MTEEHKRKISRTLKKKGIRPPLKSFNKIIKENNIFNILDARKCKEMWDINNGVTLCEECHLMTDNYKGRANK